MEAQTAPLAEMTILAVDDHAINREFLSSALRPHCREVVLAASGREAIQCCQARDMDLVLMDLHMPDMDGLTAWQHIRSGLAGRVPPRVVALTADYREGERRRLLEAGFDGFLNKPVSARVLVDTLAAIQRGEGGPAPEITSEGGPRLLDDDQALAAANGDGDLVNHLRELLAEDLDRQMPALDASLAAGQLEPAAEILHQWAGGCGYAGATRLQEACRAMEDCLASHLASSPGALYVNLANLVACTRRAIRERAAA